MTFSLLNAPSTGAYWLRLSALLASSIGFQATAALANSDDPASNQRTENRPNLSSGTFSTPIALSSDNRLLWVVNPDQDTVSVIRTDLNKLVTKIEVGDEPRGVAISPDGDRVFVANAASNSVSVIKVKNQDPDGFNASLDKKVGSNGQLITGADPRSVVYSPDGRRVYVANRSQDTITVIDAQSRRITGSYNLRRSTCNVGDRDRHFMPGALAITEDSRTLLVTRFLSYTTTTGVQRDDRGKEGIVCSFDLNTRLPGSVGISNPKITQLSATETGIPDIKGRTTYAFPNQLGSVVTRQGKAYLPNIAASPTGPSRFNTTTHAYVNVIGELSGSPQDQGNINLHLGGREPEAGKLELYFANPSAIAFTTTQGAGYAYVASAGSDILVKLKVNTDGGLGFTVDEDTTRYIDLNDPDRPETSDWNAGKTPIGLVINAAGTKAYTYNYVSRNVSVVDLELDRVVAVVRAENLPEPGSKEERVLVGAEMFFSSRGNFVQTLGALGASRNRLSEKGRQNCASCHSDGLTDGIIWQFATGPRKTLPINGTFARNDPTDQRIINATAIFDEVEDADFNTRLVSSAGPLPAPRPCIVTEPLTQFRESTVDPDHGLILGDWNNFETATCVLMPFVMPNAGRPQPFVKLPGSNVLVKAHDALIEWQQAAVRTPNRPMTKGELRRAGGDTVGGASEQKISAGRQLFEDAGCTACHAGAKWTVSKKDFVSPPPFEDITVETGAVGANQFQYLARFLKDIGSYGLNVEGAGNYISGYPAIGGVEKDNNELDALGRDHNGDGKGNGYNISSILGSLNVPPYYHNGACETLRCVLSDVNHRKAGLQGREDPLSSKYNRDALVEFLESIDLSTQSF